MFDTIKTWLHRNTVRLTPFMNGRGKWQWGLYAANGKHLDNGSEEYSRKGACYDTAKMLDGKKIRFVE